MELKEVAKQLAAYEMLTIRIKSHTRAYKELLTDYEKELKEYLQQDIPPSLIDIQNTLISKTKAKISALEDLNV